MGKQDLEIARTVTLKPIQEIGAAVGLAPGDLEPYGHYKAKVGWDAIARRRDHPDGALVLVTAMTPTPAGEGKSTTTVGLADGLRRLGKRAVVARREPSLGPVFGMKGGATGGGRAQLAPMEDINLHFTGDMHAIGAAHNLLAAMLDNHLTQGNALGIDARRVLFKRVVDMNDRALRNIVLGLGGPAHGVPREGGFEITVASEVMAILCLSADLVDFKARAGRVVVAETADGTPVTAADLRAAGAMAVLMKDAIKPNLVQTLEGTPALVHGGPFGNIAHGCNSVIATRLGRGRGGHDGSRADGPRHDQGRRPHGVPLPLSRRPAARAEDRGHRDARVRRRRGSAAARGGAEARALADDGPRAAAGVHGQDPELAVRRPEEDGPPARLHAHRARREAVRRRRLRGRLRGRRPHDAGAAEGARRRGHGRGRHGPRHRALLRMRRASRIAQTALVVAFLATAVSGCEQGGPASTSPASTAATKAAGSLRARADELSQRGQYEEALAAYREALRHEPNDLALRYAVAVTLASLNRRAEATEAYRWVFFNGLPGSELVEKSETWLRAAGALATTTEPVPDKPIEKTATDTRIRGHITWANVDPGRPAPRVHLRLEGTDASNKGTVYNTVASLNADYEFASVPPGSYRLTAQSPLIAVRLWELNVTVEEGTATVVDLSEASSVAPGTSFAVKPR